MAELTNALVTVVACSLDLAAVVFMISWAAMRMLAKSRPASVGSEAALFIKGVFRDLRIMAVFSLLWALGAGAGIWLIR